MALTPTPTWTPGTAHPRRRMILMALCLSLLVVVIDNTILNTALPSIARELGASTTGLQWVTDAYTLVFASLLITAGSIGDRFGRRRFLIAGLVVFAAGSVGAALSPDTGTLIAWRAVMGLGGAFVMPATLSLLTGVFPAEERPQAIGAWSAVAGVGIVIGPTLGGLLLDYFSWGAVFWVNVPLVVTAVAVVRAVVPEMATATAADGRTAGGAAGHSFDPIGAVLSAAGLVALVDAVIEAPSRGWLAPLTLAEAGGAVALLAGFVMWELRSSHPMMDVRVFANRAFSAASASVALVFFVLFGSLFALTQYLQLVHGYSPLSAGLRALPFAVGMGLASAVSARLVGRFGIRWVVPAGLALMAGGLVRLGQVAPLTPYPAMMWAVLVMGLGMGLVMAPASESIMTTLPPAQAGVGSAVNDTVREVGGSLGVAVLGSIVSAAYQARVAVRGLPSGLAHAVRSSVAAADRVAAGAGSSGAPLAAQAHRAFTSAMGTGFDVAAGVAIAGAVVLTIALPRPRAQVVSVSAEQVASEAA